MKKTVIYAICLLLGGGSLTLAQDNPKAVYKDPHATISARVHDLLSRMTVEEKVELFPPPGLGKWGRMLGLGTSQAKERAEWLAENLSGYSNFARMPIPLTTALHEAGLSPQRAFDLLVTHVQKTEAHNTAGLMRRHIYQGFAKAALLKDEGDLASERHFDT